MSKRVEHRERGMVQFELDMAAGEVTVIIEDRERAEVVLEPLVPGDEVAEDLIARTQVTAPRFPVMNVRIPHPAPGSGTYHVDQMSVHVTAGLVQCVVSSGDAVIVNGQVLTGTPVMCGGVKVTARLPLGSEVWATTVSADVDVQGWADYVRFSSTSGDLHVDGATDVRVRTVSGAVDAEALTTLDFNTTSGSVTVGRAWSVEGRTISGDIAIDRLTGEFALLRSESGTLRLHAVGDCRVTAVTVSGDIAITAPEAARVDARTRSVSGRVRTPRN
ncbi:DUF4097 domain-containing protein [Saccharopolyspora hirsuta]|uniref:DUF4097 domain-containing protein n=1 Tax=Saccharopolyspora hirsuta TaxID=1837 RepID=A0A5M7BQQ9_SACHI|nr:DUF4097 family beta strand repeat-containing protein [Saccharopolyspora hirsuta]KAA5829564.1 DUF4097 domain-containing protein [Saccharopolyspora hirsuta]